MLLTPYPYIKFEYCLAIIQYLKVCQIFFWRVFVLKKLIISSDCATGPKEILDNGKGGLLFKKAVLTI